MIFDEASKTKLYRQIKKKYDDLIFGHCATYRSGLSLWDKNSKISEFLNDLQIERVKIDMSNINDVVVASEAHIFSGFTVDSDESILIHDPYDNFYILSVPKKNAEKILILGL